MNNYIYLLKKNIIKRFIGRIFIVLYVSTLILGNTVLAEDEKYKDLDDLVEVDEVVEIVDETNEDNTDYFIISEDENNYEVETPAASQNNALMEKRLEIYKRREIKKDKEEEEKRTSRQSQIDKIKSTIERYKQRLLQQFRLKKGEAVEKVEELEGKLEESKVYFEDTIEKIVEIEDTLPEISDKIFSLHDQISIIDDQITISQLKIDLLTKQIEMKKEEITEKMQQLRIGNVALLEQREKVIDYMKVMYDEIRKYNNIQTKKESTFKVLLADSSFATLERRRNYFDIYQKKSRELVLRLLNKQREITEDVSLLDKKKSELSGLYANQVKEEKNLELQRQNKKVILYETQGEENKYKLLLGQYQKEQEEVENEIVTIQAEIEDIHHKLEAFDKLSNDEASRLSNLELLYVLEDDDDIDETLSKSFFKIWPVDPSGGITAYFHDPTYPFGIHNAIDVRQGQGNYIYAPAPGYVYRTKDNGMGYSYIIIAHRDNVLTVYGHISEFLVREGDLVQTGDVIGKSGGMPGTKGAGWMTTGPHLHFEVLKDGKHVNPLPYMPLEFLPVEYIPKSLLPLLEKQVRQGI